MCAMACRGHPTWVQPLLAGNRQRPTWVRPHTRGLRNVVPPPLPTYKQKAPTARGAEPVGRWPGKAEAEPPPRCRMRGGGALYQRGFCHHHCTAIHSQHRQSLHSTALPSIPCTAHHCFVTIHCTALHNSYTHANRSTASSTTCRHLVPSHSTSSRSFWSSPLPSIR